MLTPQIFGRMHGYYPLHTQKNKKEREKMATSRGVDHHFCAPGWQKSSCKGDATWKCSKCSTPIFTTVDGVNKVSPKDSPSRTAKAGSFKGCRA